MSEMNSNELESLVQAFCESEYDQLEVVSGEKSVRLKRSSTEYILEEPPLEFEESLEDTTKTHNPQDEQDSNLKRLTANRVGWFHPRVKAGEIIEVGQVVGHLKSMNIQQELKATESGEVTRILVQVGEGVDYGEPVIELRKN